jgi:hypothetical protein
VEGGGSSGPSGSSQPARTGAPLIDRSCSASSREISSMPRSCASPQPATVAAMERTMSHAPDSSAPRSSRSGAPPLSSSCEHSKQTAPAQQPPHRQACRRKRPRAPALGYRGAIRARGLPTRILRARTTAGHHHHHHPAIICVHPPRSSDWASVSASMKRTEASRRCESEVSCADAVVAAAAAATWPPPGSPSPMGLLGFHGQR